LDAGKIVGMERQRQLVPVLVGVLIPLALVATYVAAYLTLCDVGTTSVRGRQIGIIRIYATPGVAKLFEPAAMVEERITGHRVRAVRSIHE